jgi:hypothetical protein
MTTMTTMTTNEIDKAWTQAVDAALKLLDHQPAVSMSMYAKLEHYVVDNATIRLSAGQRNGLSTWIAQHATEHDLIVVPKSESVKPFIRTNSPRAQVVAADWPHYRGGTAPQRIYVDQASVLDKTQIQHLYHATTSNVEQRWFLLG